MNGLNRSLGLIAVLCLLVLAISVGLSIVYNPFEPAEGAEEPSLYAKIKSIQEMQENNRTPTFQWVGHSILSDSSVSIQIKYTGPTIEDFHEKDIDFLINRQPCKWYGQVVKEKGGKITTLKDGELLYIMVSFECAVKKGDTLTFVYQPQNLKTSAQL